MKFLCVHGLGDHRASDWEARWSHAINAALPSAAGPAEIVFLTYDDIFEEADISALDVTIALAKLSWSGITSHFTRRRGIAADVTHLIRWTAGYVVAWAEDEEFKRASRARVLAALVDEQPDVLLAHSLGSLVTYDALSHREATSGAPAEVVSSLEYVTLGSQIGNAFVRRNLHPGRIAPLPVQWWTHLYNRHDNVFTAPLTLPEAENFVQVDTPFDLPGVGNHAAGSYLSHRSTTLGLWSALGDRDAAMTRRLVPVTRRPEPRRKALLVGIDEYPDPGQRLEGCVNDVFLVSSALQERGFAPDEIRVCLNDRATADGVRTRLDWLLDDPRPGDVLLFYYSGHGVRMPAYGPSGEPDHYDEALVPVDFDWTDERAIKDDDILDLYVQLPYSTDLAMIFDCCHAGGIHRDGAPRARGITPPDDIRHRALAWDREARMWVPRDLEPINEAFSSEEEVQKDFFGQNGVTSRIGRAARIRSMTEDEYRHLDEVRRETKGPYLPLIIEACREDQYAYEYRHGVTSYGAFTYAFVDRLRRGRAQTFRSLVRTVRRQLDRIGYDRQHPQILGPASVVDGEVPWL
jgi:hypothetical protein